MTMLFRIPKISSNCVLSIRKYCKKNGGKSQGSIWNYFKGGCKKEEVPSLEAHTKHRDRKVEFDLYKTYISQKKISASKDSKKSKEDRILEKIEADFSIKMNVEDPMPPFQSVEQRMLDLAERRLHPFYKKYLSMARPIKIEENENKLELGQPYKCKTGPIQPEEIPEHLRLSKEMLEKKNIFVDFKGVELPRQMLIKIIEINNNKKPTLEKNNNKKETKGDK